MLLALAAIVMGSQQLLVMPNQRPQDSEGGEGFSLGMKSGDRHDSQLEETEKLYMQAIAKRLSLTHRDGRPNTFQVYALQVPMMLLSLSIVAFLAGLCSVIFAPLVKKPAWDDNAKVRVCRHPFSNCPVLIHKNRPRSFSAQ